MLNDEQVVDSGTNENNMEDSRSSATVNPSHDIRYNPLSLPNFSGVVPTPKSETNFKVWHHTLKAIISEEQLHDNRIKQLVRRSLTGEAAEVLVNLPVTASSKDIIDELISCYDTTGAKVDGWSAFHSASQRVNEPITEWKIRLLRLYIEADPQEIFKDQKDSMLIAAFWTNLDNKDLRIAMAPHRTLPFASFFRMVKENEPLFVRHHKPAKAAVTNNASSEIEHIRKQMEELKAANENLKKQLRHKDQRKPNIIRCYNCGDTGHMIRSCQKHPKTRSGKRRKETLSCRRNSKSPTIENHFGTTKGKQRCGY